MADPTPALPSGTADMIEPVNDGVDRAMPADMVIIGATSTMYGVPGVTKENINMPAAARPMPKEIVRLSPMWEARRGPRGARIMIVAANGSWAMPAFRAS